MGWVAGYETEEAGFFERMAAAGNDNQPRLEYADWLDKHGRSAVSEFIKIQCGLHSTLPEGTVAGREREKQLKAEILGPKIANLLEQAPWRVTFDRGMIMQLNLSSEPVTRLPDNLHIDGPLKLDGTSITNLPDHLHVGGSLNLEDTAITNLPDHLHVGGYLDLRGTAITSLPEHLHVGGSLYLAGTAITSLPDHLRVGGDLDLSGTAITSLPDHLHVGGHLDLRNTAITNLPDHLHVDGHLVLRGTRIDRAGAEAMLALPSLSDSAKGAGFATWDTMILSRVSHALELSSVCKGTTAALAF